MGPYYGFIKLFIQSPKNHKLLYLNYKSFYDFNCRMLQRTLFCWASAITSGVARNSQ